MTLLLCLTTPCPHGRAQQALCLQCGLCSLSDGEGGELEVWRPSRGTTHSRPGHGSRGHSPALWVLTLAGWLYVACSQHSVSTVTQPQHPYRDRERCHRPQRLGETGRQHLSPLSVPGCLFSSILKAHRLGLAGSPVTQGLPFGGRLGLNSCQTSPRDQTHNRSPGYAHMVCPFPEPHSLVSPPSLHPHSVLSDLGPLTSPTASYIILGDLGPCLPHTC